MISEHAQKNRLSLENFPTDVWDKVLPLPICFGGFETTPISSWFDWIIAFNVGIAKSGLPINTTRTI